jgi:hypothetical protein
VTTTASEGFTIATQGGEVAVSWSDVDQLPHGVAGGAEAYVRDSGQWFVGTVTKIIYLTVPNYITALDNGAEFQSLTVTVNIDGDPFPKTLYVRLTGGDWKSATYTSAATNYDFTGDESYWGVAGTPQQIFSDLKDGSIGVELYCPYNTLETTINLNSVQSALTYRPTDTKRAALQVTIP